MYTQNFMIEIRRKSFYLVRDLRTEETIEVETHIIEEIASVTDETLGEKVIKEEYRKGYKIGSKVIRHSMVVVAN